MSSFALLDVHSGAADAVFGPGNTNAAEHGFKTAPMFSGDVDELLGPRVYPQRALYGRIMTQVIDGAEQDANIPALYINTNTPFSGVICGAQGTGKGHSTSVILEGCLMKDNRLGTLLQPLSALVFHFNRAVCGRWTRPCEAAYLSALDADRGGNGVYPPAVTVLVFPSSLDTMKGVYAPLPHVEVKPLHFSQADLTADRLLSLIRVDEGSYATSYTNLITDMLRTSASPVGDGDFRSKWTQHEHDPNRKAMLQLWLGLLQSCSNREDESNSVVSHFRAGRLTIIDLTSPFVDSSSACILFDIILGLFLESGIESGKVVVFDQADEYLGDGHGSERLANSLVTLVKNQRHLNTRTIISTQEPTLVPHRFLELCSFVIAHRFLSPQSLSHLFSNLPIPKAQQSETFSRIVDLQTGQAIVFSPSGLGAIPVELRTLAPPPAQGVQIVARVKPFGQGYLIVQSRLRVTRDGGQSLLATPARLEVPNSYGTRPASGGVEEQQTSVTRPDVSTMLFSAATTTASTSILADHVKVQVPADAPQREQKTFTKFLPLVEVLMSAASAAGARPQAGLLWSVAASALKKRGTCPYRGKFSQYADEAERAGLIRNDRIQQRVRLTRRLIDTLGINGN